MLPPRPAHRGGYLAEKDSERRPHGGLQPTELLLPPHGPLRREKAPNETNSTCSAVTAAAGALSLTPPPPLLPSACTVSNGSAALSRLPGRSVGACTLAPPSLEISHDVWLATGHRHGEAEAPAAARRSSQGMAAITTMTVGGVDLATVRDSSAVTLSVTDAYQEALLLVATYADGCGESEAWHLRQCRCTENLLRYIIGLEQENEVLRLALIEGSERRLRRRFCGGLSRDGGYDQQQNDFSSVREFSSNHHLQQHLLQRVKEVEQNVRSYFQDELERLQKQHTTDTAAAVQGGTRGESYESTLAQSERRRWKEHVRHTVEELTLLHREKEKQAAGVTATSVAFRTEGSGCRHARDGGNCDSADSRIAVLQTEVEHWKCEAEKARAHAKLYQDQALKELQHMHAVYRNALGEERSAFPGADATPLATGGMVGELTVSDAAQEHTADEAAAPPTPNLLAPSCIKEEKEKKETYVEKQGDQAASRGFPRHTSPPLSRATSRASGGGEEAEKRAATAPHLFDATVGPTEAAAGSQKLARRSYHSDVYLRRESVTNDERVSAGV
ncbi:hypothetical protein TraAM80_09009 [Trypanosoma rangeli]|uniref:Uncharacterized protein n=1 Tax=Trypanosoma rangeli TaxID=5698 RepID=A0A3R7M2A4_TRYRA|nr:uncharacterized protein TraAM80_09009 [Trypanosoma rangeli]RNE98041.1 hypothetical protein TraAM80_09009 [Trypanosoma rangeli]|eukprot:RNE98041.1 hypothetical protein TraAM80_09009 [Trypanosoma rangeli]